MIVGAAPPERAGAASAISETGQEFGFAIGVAILGSIGTAVYRRSLDDTLPDGVPAQEAAVARNTLGGALEVAGNLLPAAGAEMIEVARMAFTQGLQFNVTAAAVLAAGAALLLRQVRPGSEPVEETLTDSTEPAANPTPSGAVTPAASTTFSD